jgi:LytS/YehU family sensor histidine kinase
VSTYLEIEKIRFGERLKVQIEMEPEVRERQLPAFVVQTLVENCIKHGIAKIIGKGIVSIDAYQEGEYMICEVYDNGPGIQDERINKGTGLNNILTRLEKTYNEQDLLKFENTGEGTLVRLKVPLSS